MIVSWGGGILGSCCHSSVRVAACHSCTVSGSGSPSRTGSGSGCSFAQNSLAAFVGFAAENASPLNSIYR